MNRISATRDRSFLSRGGASPSQMAHTLLQTPYTRQWQCLSNSLQHIRTQTGPWVAPPLILSMSAPAVQDNMACSVLVIHQDAVV